MKRSLFMVLGNFLPVRKSSQLLYIFIFCGKWHTLSPTSRKPATIRSPCLKEGCPKKNSVFHIMSFRIIIPGDVFFPLPPLPPCSVLLGHSCKCKYESASNCVQHYEQPLQNLNAPLVSQELKSSKQLPVEDLSCWNVQSLDENGTKQMNNIIESNVFPLMYQ